MQYTAFPTNDRGWQYTSSGQISGITGNVDLNAFGYRTPTTRYREVLIDGKWYYIDATTGKKVTGWQWLSSSGGKWVYYDPTDGHMLYGEQKIAGKWYYLNPVSGARMTGWVVLPDGRNVYYSPYMVYGEQKINGAWYYLDPVTALASRAGSG